MEEGVLNSDGDFLLFKEIMKDSDDRFITVDIVDIENYLEDCEKRIKDMNKMDYTQYLVENGLGFELGSRYPKREITIKKNSRIPHDSPNRLPYLGSESFVKSLLIGLILKFNDMGLYEVVLERYNYTSQYDILYQIAMTMYGLKDKKQEIDDSLSAFGVSTKPCLDMIISVLNKGVMKDRIIDLDCSGPGLKIKTSNNSMLYNYLLVKTIGVNYGE